MIELEYQSPFNSSLETGVRSLVILVASFPEEFDLQRLVDLDYLVVHSGDADGPESLHIAMPLRIGELLVRRSLIEKGIFLMMSRGLIRRIPSDDGFKYVAAETAGPFISSLTADYTCKLKERAEWAASKYQSSTTEEIRFLTNSIFRQWSNHFYAAKSIEEPK